MNQLFNPVNYFEFQAFAALRRRSIPPSYFSHRAWKQKSRRGIPARGGFLIDSLPYDRSRESSVGWSITAVAVSP